MRPVQFREEKTWYFPPATLFRMVQGRIVDVMAQGFRIC